eukprot:CAMPEP_0172552760 /NCGR_PEP_ID=MMETSP1067-20121228/47177_1 /TAXON_ID=265564 ORGANISM="Thalassiosira punctigera, Strain Tpunct2005C2" /NCGR_SAMPLE_ID=MMETSP1067 /ASSEMBLY_ACC=CAM_ASM_000444 /LENGTH=140 /DNA_ID=CAMNT_0013340813 /DNA_START=454 /DNA_END=876 /DNA_ORIENTATION=+
MEVSEVEFGREQWGKSGPDVMLARSFDEALDLALRELPVKFDVDVPWGGVSRNESGSIDCWVGGGERIYREALQHDNVSEVHLTHIDMTLDIDQSDVSKSAVAYFPLEDLERNGFEETSRVQGGRLCTFCVYKRGPRKKG